MAEHIIPSIIENSASQFADHTAVRWAVKKEIIDRKYTELDRDRRRVANALKDRGFKGSQIALLGLSAYEWIVSYLGITSGRMTAVPLDVMLPVDDIIDLINRSDSKALFLAPKLEAYREPITKACSRLELVIMLDENESDGTGENVITFGDLIAGVSDEALSGDDVPGEDDVCTFIYTSGTTGKSKGVMLTQRNLYDNVDSVVITADPGMVMLSVLPIHHAYCLVMDWLKGFSKGATLAINDSLIHMVRNMARFQPRIMLMVPLMIETIYKRLSAADPSIPREEVAKSVFGENIKTIYSGGAHLDPFYIDEMAKYSVEVCEGYGMSECSPVISTNGELGIKKGSVGLPLSNCEVRIKDGEVVVRGSSVMKGYYKMPKETEETLVDGWLHTGDLGYLDEDGFLFITGRKKNLIILSNGENVSPEEVETKISLISAVGEVVIEGEEKGNGLCALIYPDQDYVDAKGLSPAQVEEEIQQGIDEFNKTQPTYRAITDKVIRRYPFLKSSTKKIKRPQAHIDEPPEE